MKTIIKPKTCRVCRGEFTPRQPMAKVCSSGCALTLAQSKRARAEKVAEVQERRADKAKREKLKTRAQWAKEAQVEVNRYVRLRDSRMGCVSCDRPASWEGQWHASHFRSVGAAPGLRFHLWNIHKACSVCNNHLSGNLAGFLPRLIDKIGADRVAWLQQQNSVCRRDADYFKRVKAVFAKRARRLEKRAPHV